MKRLMIIGLWPDDTVNYCTEKCDCRRYAFDRILYHKGGRAARERICIPVVDRSGAATTYLDLPVTLLEAGVVYLRLDDGSDIFLSDTQMALIANEVERRRAECAGTGLKTLGKWFESGLPTAEDYLEPGDEVDEGLIGYFLDVLPPRTAQACCRWAEKSAPQRTSTDAGSRLTLRSSDGAEHGGTQDGVLRALRSQFRSTSPR